MSRRSGARKARADEGADRDHADRLWAAAMRGDRAAFDRLFGAWLAASYAAAWQTCHDRLEAQTRVRAQMLRAFESRAAALTASGAARRR